MMKYLYAIEIRKITSWLKKGDISAYKYEGFDDVFVNVMSSFGWDGGEKVKVIRVYLH